MTPTPAPTRSRNWLWVAVAILAIVHQDFWWWGSRTLVLGFMPIGLFYQVIFSLVSAGLWFAAIKWAWPDEIEAWADELHDDPAAHGAAVTSHPDAEGRP